jgi:hypothetical protein
MEMFVALMLLFLAGTASYGLAHVWVGARDLWRSLGLHRRAPTPLREAHEGQVVLRGEARRGQRLLPALNRDAPGCVAYATRSGFGRRGDELATVFEIFDGTGVARIEATHPVLLAPEANDVFGELTREIRPGDIVTVVGQLSRVVEPDGTITSLREPPTSLVVRDLPERGLVIYRRSWQPARTLAKGIGALAVSALGIWLTVVTIGA